MTVWEWECGSCWGATTPSHQCLAEHCKLSVMIQISLDDLTVFIYSSYSMPWLCCNLIFVNLFHPPDGIDFFSGGGDSGHVLPLVFQFIVLCFEPPFLAVPAKTQNSNITVNNIDIYFYLVFTHSFRSMLMLWTWTICLRTFYYAIVNRVSRDTERLSLSDWLCLQHVFSTALAL